MPRYRYNPCSYLPRRLQIVVSLTLTVFVIVLFFGSSSDQASKYRSGLSQGARLAANALPDHVGRSFSESILNPFRVPAHNPPPEQSNSTSGDVSWFRDFKWRNPFSHTISHDERAVLPMQAKRVPIYTYYDYTQKLDKAEKEAEHNLILTWRKAWWAKGFKPVVLGKADAKQNPLYKKLQELDFKAGGDADLLRWLAWGSMGTGILSNYLALPMCNYNDDMMVFLRQGKFEQLTRFKGLTHGFLAGEKQDINDGIRQALATDGAVKGLPLVDMLAKGTFRLEGKHNGVAFYYVENLNKQYNKLYDKIRTTPVEGKIQLRKLIEAHLQAVWQSQYTEGIAALRPLPESMTAATETALALAQNLTSCLVSPLPTTCPPNMPNCKPCLPSHPLPIETTPVYRNDSAIFSIGTIPHPFTTATLMKRQRITTTRFVRRETVRDPYILALTKEALGTGRSAYDRIVYFKEAIASPLTASNALWLTAEGKRDAAWREDVSWQLGFPLPSEKVNDGKSETPVPGPERRVPKDKGGKKKKEFKKEGMPDEKGVKREGDLIEECKSVLKRRKEKANKKLIGAVEGWNMADREVWGFVRAWNAQRRVEREGWIGEERGFAGG